MQDYMRRGFIGIYVFWVCVAVARCAGYFRRGKRLAGQWNARALGH